MYVHMTRDRKTDTNSIYGYELEQRIVQYMDFQRNRSPSNSPQKCFYISVTIAELNQVKLFAKYCNQNTMVHYREIPFIYFVVVKFIYS